MLLVGKSMMFRINYTDSKEYREIPREHDWTSSDFIFVDDNQNIIGGKRKKSDQNQIDKNPVENEDTILRKVNIRDETKYKDVIIEKDVECKILSLRNSK